MILLWQNDKKNNLQIRFNREKIIVGVVLVVIVVVIYDDDYDDYDDNLIM